MSSEPLIVTSCHGEYFWLAIEPWVEHLLEVDTCPIEIVSLDGRRYSGRRPGASTFIVETKGGELRWGAVDPIRLGRILFHLKQGRTCIQVDVDVRMKRKFSVLCDLPYDVIVSRAFDLPSFAAEKLGFVACCGFFIVKPSSGPLCEIWLRDLQQNTRQLGTDQEVLNAMMCEAQPPREETVQVGNLFLKMDVFEIAGCTLAVLPKEAILRDLDTEASLFGNHARPILKHFLVKDMRRHPAKVLKQLASTSPLGLFAIRVRDFARRAAGGSMPPRRG